MTVRSTPNADDRLSRRRKARSRGTQTGRKDRSGALTAKARPGADKSAATGAPRGAACRKARAIGFALFGAPPPSRLAGRTRRDVSAWQKDESVCAPLVEGRLRIIFRERDDPCSG
jgi:hypothetical protein